MDIPASTLFVLSEVGFLLLIGAGLFTLWLAWRWRRAANTRDRYHREVHRLTQRVQMLEAARKAPIEAPANKDTMHAYLFSELRHCELLSDTLEKSDPKRAAIEIRRRALQAELLAFDAGTRRDDALPLVLPAYVVTGRGRNSASAKELVVLKQRLTESEQQMAKLTQYETLYHDLRAAFIGNTQSSQRMTEQLQSTLAPKQPGDDVQSIISGLLNNFTELQKMLEGGDKQTSLHLMPDLATAIEQGKKLEAMFNQGQQDINQWRNVQKVDAPADDDAHASEISALSAKLKNSERNLREASGCIDTLERNLEEARTMLKKVVDRVRRFQDQESRIAILEARAKQAEKEVRIWSKLHGQLDARVRQDMAVDKAVDKTVKGDTGISKVQQAYQEKLSEFERLIQEKSMLEEQIIELDAWRDRAELAESALRRALDEKQMMEEQVLSWADEESTES